jgi:anaerobic ribonucleoside-triphosphate reductase activating protein
MIDMLTARILYPVEVLGIGKRVGIWVCGCNHSCHACSNPELWEFDKSKDISVDSLCEIVKTIYDNNVVDGFTITGGEPFDQAEELMELLLKLKNLSTDILVYTGYTINELLNRQNLAINTIFKTIAVLIDGRYVDELNNDVFMRGSSNQNIIILNKDYESMYGNYFMNGKNRIQNFTLNNENISVGIHTQKVL